MYKILNVTQITVFLFRYINFAIKIASKIIALFLIFTIKFIRPLLGPPNICPFTIGCTPFAIDQLSTQPLHKACYVITKRLFQCHPFGKRSS